MRELGSSQPTAVELEILRILWELGPSPVATFTRGSSGQRDELFHQREDALGDADQGAGQTGRRARRTSGERDQRERAAKKFLTELIEKSTTVQP